MNAFLSFLKSRDGIVALATIVLLAIVSHFGTPYNPWVNFAGRVGNILVFLYILWRAGGKLLADSIKNRRSGIEEEFASLEQRKSEAQTRLQDLEKHIANLDAERNAILDESKQQAATMRQSILAQAEADAKRIRDQATRAAEGELKTARENLRATLADEIVRTVEEVLKSRLASNEAEGMVNHTHLIDNALKKVVLH